jgi:hypothetical protein
MELYVELKKKLNEAILQAKSIEIKKKVIKTAGVLIDEKKHTIGDILEANRCRDLFQCDFTEELNSVLAQTSSIDPEKILDVMYLRFKLEAIKKEMEEEDVTLLEKIEKETILRQATQRVY